VCLLEVLRVAIATWSPTWIGLLLLGEAQFGPIFGPSCTPKTLGKLTCRVAQHVSHTLFFLADPSGLEPLIADTVSSTTGGLGHPLSGWRQNDALHPHFSLTA
jgi:hypothetical protein